jgi:ParB family chromosome partitioning protein
MAKNFAPRVSKKDRKTVSLSEKFDRDIFQVSDDKLLRGAKLEEVSLKDIKVKEQVRTKFDDKSLKDLAENIKANGLIQPLVVHRVKGTLTLVCGERRYRAMASIDMEKAPCFILDDKSEEELMAIQFSENSSREELHYIDKADGIYAYKKSTDASERKIQAALGISKSEVHRSLLLAKLPKELREAAKKFDIEKYVLLEFQALEENSLRTTIFQKIKKGEIRKRIELKTALKGIMTPPPGGNKLSKKTTKVKSPTANDFIKAMKEKSKNLNLDKEMKNLLKSLVKETTSEIKKSGLNKKTTHP